MIIITGGAGFIGSALAYRLNQKGRNDIVIVDQLRSEQKWKNLLGISYIDFWPKDELFMRLGQLETAPEVIYHLGACSSTTETDVDYLMANNVEYSQAVFHYCSSEQIPLIYASSAATYGKGELGYDDQSSIEKLRPLNPYGYSKQLFDLWALKQTVTPPKWFGVKFFNVFGPQEYHKKEMRSLVVKAFEQIQSTGKVKLFKSHRPDFKDGEQLRDFIYVFDAVDGVIQLAEGPNAENGLYNMGTGKAHSFVDLVTPIFKALDKEVKIEFIDMPESIRNQYQYYTQAEMKKFSEKVGQISFRSLEKTVTDYVANFLAQEDQYFQK